MARFYFTYGSEGQPYVGGWSEVEAEDEDAARELFRLVHPLRDGFLPCGGIYTESEFNRTRMWKDGNFGAFCHERIRLEVRHLHDHRGAEKLS